MSEEKETRTPDLVDKLLGGLDYLLDLVHDKVLRPIILGARFLAYGLIIVLAVVVLVSVLVIGLVRLFDIYVFNGRVWITYAAIGSASMLTGLIIWRRRRPLNLRK